LADQIAFGSGDIAFFFGSQATGDDNAVTQLESHHPPKPTIEKATDAIIKITKTTICGTDLHILRGDVPTCKPGTVLGHEGVGIVDEVGSGVVTFKLGDSVIVTGCLGAKKEGDVAGTEGNLIRQMHPSVLAVTGPHATQEVMDAVHTHLPKPHDPFVDLVPNSFGVAGIKLTPRHYAYLKISEGCNHRCTFCIIPSMRGDLVSRPIGDVLSEAHALFKGGVKELLVISQDTSAYGVDVKYRMGFWDGKPVKTRMLELVQTLGEIAEQYGAWVRLHYVYPYPSVDEIIPLMATGKVLPYLDVPLQHSHPDVLKRMKRPASGEKNMERILRWREVCPEIVIRSTFIAGFPGETEAEFAHLLDFMKEAKIDRAGCFAYSPVEGATANDIPGMLPLELREERRARFMEVAEAVSAAKLQTRVGATMQVLVDSAPALGKKGGIGRTYADAPEIDGVVKLLPPEKISKTLKVGEFTKARIVGTQGHDLVALPI